MTQMADPDIGFSLADVGKMVGTFVTGGGFFVLTKKSWDAYRDRLLEAKKDGVESQAQVTLLERIQKVEAVVREQDNRLDVLEEQTHAITMSSEMSREQSRAAHEETLIGMKDLRDRLDKLTDIMLEWRSKQ